MAEKRNGAGSRLAGLLERATPPEPFEPDETEAAGAAEAEPEAAAARGRGAAPKKPRAAEARPAKKVPGRTLYIPDDLWERVIVQAHRRKLNYSEFVVRILERQVPDHRVVRADPAGGGEAA